MAFSQRYVQYLASPEWSAKRKQYFAAFGKKCQVCGSKFGIEVDHLDYTHLGREPLADLLGLCHDHHVEITLARQEAGLRAGDYRKFTAGYFRIKLPTRVPGAATKVPPRGGKGSVKGRKAAQAQNASKLFERWWAGEKLNKRDRQIAVREMRRREVQGSWRTAKAAHEANQRGAP